MRKGFTLIELLVVIAIIAILAAILFPVFGKAREKARQTHCTNNQKSFGTAVQIYSQEHEETLPVSATFWGDIKVDKAALKCMTKPSLDNGYAYNGNNSGLGIGQLRTTGNKIKDADTVWLTADSDSGPIVTDPTLLAAKRHNGSLIAAYLDGHVEMVPGNLVGWKFSEPVTSTATRSYNKTLTAPGTATWTVSPTTGVTIVATTDTSKATFNATVNGVYTVKATSTLNTAYSQTFTITAGDPTPAALSYTNAMVSSATTVPISTPANYLYLGATAANGGALVVNNTTYTLTPTQSAGNVFSNVKAYVNNGNSGQMKVQISTPSSPMFTFTGPAAITSGTAMMDMTCTEGDVQFDVAVTDNSPHVLKVYWGQRSWWGVIARVIASATLTGVTPNPAAVTYVAPSSDTPPTYGVTTINFTGGTGASVLHVKMALTGGNGTSMYLGAVTID